MKKIMIQNEVATDLLTKLEAYKNKQNCIRFTIGIKKYPDGLGSQVQIVNGAQMARIGFATSLPTDDAEQVENTPYMCFNLKADDFYNYLSGLIGYKTDIGMEYNGTQVLLIVGALAKIPLNTLPDESCEPLLMQDHKKGLVRMQIKANDFLRLFRKGGFLSSLEVDTVRKVTDRVVLKLSGNRCCMYSSDGHSIAKAWCNADVTFVQEQYAVLHLRKKGATLDKESQQKMLAEMEPFKTNPESMIAYAKEMHGFELVNDMQISIPNACVSTIQKIVKGIDMLSIIITDDNIHMMAGSVLATFALAGEVSTVYANTVDPWEKTKWSAKVIVDRESLNRALSILRLSGEEKVPFYITVDCNGIATKKSGNEIHTTILASEGNTGAINSAYNVNRILDVLSKLANGNVILRFMTESKNHPISISNGSLEENDIDSYAYVLPINLPKEAGAN